MGNRILMMIIIIMKEIGMANVKLLVIITLPTSYICVLIPIMSIDIKREIFISLQRPKTISSL